MSPESARTSWKSICSHLLPLPTPRCIKKPSIISMPKKNKIACLNDYHLTSTIMECFKRLVKVHLISSHPDSFDPLQVAVCQNKSMEDAISQPDTFPWNIWITKISTSDSYLLTRSTNSTMIPTKRIPKLLDLGLGSPLCN